MQTVALDERSPEGCGRAASISCPDSDRQLFLGGRPSAQRIVESGVCEGLREKIMEQIHRVRKRRQITLLIFRDTVH